MNILVFFRQVYGELLHRVAWPSEQEVERLVMMFFLVVSVAGAGVMAQNFVLEVLMRKVYTFIS